MQKETTEGNRLIAEFMGAEWKESIGWTLDRIYFADYTNCTIKPDERENNQVWENHIFYHTSWDWLMPVAKKIKDYLQNMERPSINHCCHGDILEIDIQCHIWDIDIKQAHEAIVVWIQWYNSLNNK